MGGGSALQTVCCWGGGVDCEVKIWQGGGVSEKTAK